MRLVSWTLAFVLSFLSIQSSYAGMKMISTMKIVEEKSVSLKRAELISLLKTPEVQSEMVKFGVNPAEAVARVKSLSPLELEEMSRQIENSPAGAGPLGTIIGAALFVFVVLLITDILGLTKVFSFTRSVR